jgi:Domain of unknown function (DUF4124)
MTVASECVASRDTRPIIRKTPTPTEASFMSRRNFRRSPGLAAALCGLFLPAVLSAATYRWVDETGTTIYSQSPPKDVEAQRIETVVTPPQPAAPPRTEPAKTEPPAAPVPASPEAQAKKQKEDKQAAADKVKAQKVRKKNCEAARHNLETLQNLGPRRIRHPDGTYERPTEDQVEQRIQETKEQVQEWCK